MVVDVNVEEGWFDEKSNIHVILHLGQGYSTSIKENEEMRVTLHIENKRG